MFHREGERFDDYRLVKFLGEGTSGKVYVAEHIHSREQVAVKILKFQLTPRTMAGFLREARLVRLKHPHIISLLDFGVSEQYFTPFLVMDYARNGTLRKRYPYGVRVPLAQVVLYVQQIASGLQYAHDRHLVHRDVKPENILLDEQYNLLLSDFGIAAIAHSDNALSRQSMAGTITYMAPEQIEGKPGTASDQYALAVMVYEWLCGVPPFQGNMSEILAQHCKASPRSLRHFIPDLPFNIESTVLKALAKDSRQRFASVHDFAQALTHAQAHPVWKEPSKLERATGWLSTSAETLPIYTQNYMSTSLSTEQPPTASESWLQEGDTFYRTRHYKEALAAFNRALLLNPYDARGYSGRSMALYELKRYSEALAACDFAIQLDPNFAAAYHTKGLVLEQLARKREAGAAFAKARALKHRG